MKQYTQYVVMMDELWGLFCPFEETRPRGKEIALSDPYNASLYVQLNSTQLKGVYFYKYTLLISTT